MGKMRTVILSVHARHIEAMAAGRKRYELRKTRPCQAQTPFRAVVVETGSDGAVRGAFVCDNTVDMTDWDDATVARLADITAEEVRAYRIDRRRKRCRLYGWRVMDFERIEGQSVADYGLQEAPQSWCYVPREIVEALKGVEKGP